MCVEKLITIPINIDGTMSAKVEKVHKVEDKNPNKIEKNADCQKCFFRKTAAKIVTSMVEAQIVAMNSSPFKIEGTNKNDIR